MLNIIRNNFSQYNGIKSNNLKNNASTSFGNATKLRKAKAVVWNMTEAKAQDVSFQVFKNTNVLDVNMIKGAEKIGSIQASFLNRQATVLDIHAPLDEAFSGIKTTLFQAVMESAFIKGINKVVVNSLDSSFTFLKRVGMVVDEAAYGKKQAQIIKDEIARCTKKGSFDDFRFKFEGIEMTFPKEVLKNKWVPLIKKEPTIMNKEQIAKLDDLFK